MKVPLDPRAEVRSLAIANEQMVEIAKAQSFRSRILMRPQRSAARQPALWPSVLETMDRMPCPKLNRGEHAIPQGLRRTHQRSPDRHTAEIKIRLAIMNRLSALRTAEIVRVT